MSPVAPSDSPAVLQRRAIAARIRAHCAEQKPPIRPRKLSLAMGRDSSHLATVLSRLEAGRDVELGTLVDIATAMGRPVAWLITGEMPEGVRLDSLPTWPEVSAEVERIFGFDRALLADIGAHRVPDAPPIFDVPALADIARGWARATRRP